MQDFISTATPFKHPPFTQRDLEKMLVDQLRGVDEDRDNVAQNRPIKGWHFQVQVGAHHGHLLVAAVPRNQTVRAATEPVYRELLKVVRTTPEGTSHGGVISNEHFRDAAVTGTFLSLNGTGHARVWDNPVGLMEHFRGMEGFRFIFDHAVLQ